MEVFLEPLTPSQETNLVSRMLQGDFSARETLILHNLRLVAHIAKKYKSPLLDFDEMVSIGTIGLIKGISNFNPSKGGKLVTFCSRCIENEILMFLRSEKKHQKNISLFEPIGTDKNGNNINFLEIKADDNASFQDKYEHLENLKWLYDNIQNILTPLEFDIISNRYGLFGCSPKTQRIIASKYNLSRSYISRIEKKALNKLSKSFFTND